MRRSDSKISKHGWMDLYPSDLQTQAKIHELLNWHHHNSRQKHRQVMEVSSEMYSAASRLYAAAANHPGAFSNGNKLEDRAPGAGQPTKPRDASFNPLSDLEQIVSHARKLSMQADELPFGELPASQARRVSGMRMEVRRQQQGGEVLSPPSEISKLCGSLDAVMARLHRELPQVS